MAGQIKIEELTQAVNAFCASIETPAAYNDETRTFVIGNDSISLEDGKLVASNDELKEKVLSNLLDLREESKPAKLPAPRKAVSNVPAVNRNAEAKNFDVNQWRSSQDRSYNVAGKTAPNAFMASEEANKRGFCTTIIAHGRSEDLAWAHVRITDPKTGQYREDIVSHDKESFVLLKSWEDANSQNRYAPGLIIGVDDRNLPMLDPNRKIKGMPAQLWLTMQVIRAWTFADRDALTKAERRAQLKMLNREWREEDEISLEDEERAAVEEMQRK